MRSEEFITEMRKPLLKWLQEQFPTWPEYVVTDLLYKGCKGFTKSEDIEEFVGLMKKDSGTCKWKLATIPISFDKFDKDTQRRMKERGMGKSNPYQVPNDEQRHQQQASMIKKSGVSKEPIIVVSRQDGYELIEGWHRTLQHLQSYPNGYNGPAWVGTV